MGVYTLQRNQKIPAPVKEVWAFISSPANLKLITPPYMGFDIVTANVPEKIYAGMIIAYNVKPLLGIKMRWVTEISQVRENEYFVDEQRYGPYTFWHHQHILTAIEGGTLMTDIVNYQPPMGYLGDIANTLFIKAQLGEIFDFRVKAVEKLFGQYDRR